MPRRVALLHTMTGWLWILALSPSWTTQSHAQSAIRAAAAPAEMVTTIVSEQPRYRAADSTWLYQYAIQVGSTRQRGPYFGIQIDVRGPASLGFSTGTVSRDARWYGFPRGDVIADAPFGVARITPQAFPRAGWRTNVQPNGFLTSESMDEPPFPTAIRARQRVTYAVASQGFPMLRDARILPFQPLGEYDPTLNREVFPIAALRRAGIFLDTVRTVVAGPGVPAADMTPAVVSAQIALACEARLVSADICRQLDGALVRFERDARGTAMALAGLLENAGAPHPLVGMTVVPQLRLLATGTIPVGAFLVSP